MQQIQDANHLVDNLISILDRAMALGIPWLVENPQSSLLWRERAFRRLATNTNVEKINTHMCGFRAPWRKPTTLMCSRLVGSHRLQRICRCTLPSRYCSFSLKPHVVLQGRDLQGISWTRRAQEYTPQFADVIANVFFDSAWSVEFSCRLREIGGLRGPPKALTASSGGCASFALHRASDVT